MLSGANSKEIEATVLLASLTILILICWSETTHVKTNRVLALMCGAQRTVTDQKNSRTFSSKILLKGLLQWKCPSSSGGWCPGAHRVQHRLRWPSSGLSRAGQGPERWLPWPVLSHQHVWTQALWPSGVCSWAGALHSWVGVSLIHGTVIQCLLSVVEGWALSRHHR